MPRFHFTRFRSDLKHQNHTTGVHLTILTMQTWIPASYGGGGLPQCQIYWNFVVRAGVSLIWVWRSILLKMSPNLFKSYWCCRPWAGRCHFDRFRVVKIHGWWISKPRVGIRSPKNLLCFFRTMFIFYYNIWWPQFPWPKLSNVRRLYGFGVSIRIETW